MLDNNCTTSRLTRLTFIINHTTLPPLLLLLLLLNNFNTQWKANTIDCPPRQKLHTTPSHLQTVIDFTWRPAQSVPSETSSYWTLLQLNDNTRSFRSIICPTAQENRWMMNTLFEHYKFRGYWHQRADDRHGNPPPRQPEAISGQRQSWKTPRWARGKQVHGMW